MNPTETHRPATNRPFQPLLPMDRNTSGLHRWTATSPMGIITNQMANRGRSTIHLRPGNNYGRH